MKQNKDTLLEMLRDGRQMSLSQQFRLALFLSIPAIVAQLSSMLMQYIDTAMVGRLGAEAGASIGLVSTSTWIAHGFVMGLSSGFSVQIAHLCGAKRFGDARQILRRGMGVLGAFSVVIALICFGIAGRLPVWLGGTAEICSDASCYFTIYSAFIPIAAVGWLANSSLQASGNMKIPSILYTSMCALDVLFNYLFIYMAGMGVKGAALGTGLSQLVVTIAALWYVSRKSDDLKRISGESYALLPERSMMKTAWGITGPLWLQNIILRGAHVMSTIIVAPLGPIAIAANAFAITAESFCYMPGYGIEEAATTLVGQSLGAGRKEFARQFTRITILMAAAVMTVLGVVMYIFAPKLMAMLSTDASVIELGARCLRIEAFAETMYAVSMVGYGACVGAGDTMVPTALNFCSMWVVRIGLAAILTPMLGLAGYWIAMCIDLNLRGLLFIGRIKGEKWLSKKVC